MKSVYLIGCVYNTPSRRHVGQFQNIAFKTEEEATNYCDYHSDKHQHYYWSKIMVGKFTLTPKIMKKKDKNE